MQRQAAEDNLPLCQGRLCKNFTITTLAAKVCHHCDCQSSNSGSPLVLCLDCDRATHAGNYKNHARFELKGNEGFDKMSSSKIAESDSGAEDDQEPIVTVPVPEKGKSKTMAARRKFMKLPTDNSKKKPRRHNTDDPGRDFIRLKVYVEETGDFNLEMIPALKAKTLKESLEPILEKYGITFESHSVFLDSSNTPLPLAFETFPLSGSILHVRDNARTTVDKRVRDISKNYECKPQPEQPVSRTPSFNKQKEEKDSAAKVEEKEADEPTIKKGKRSGGTPVDNEERSLSAQSGSVGKDSGKGKPAGILTGLFAANPATLMKMKEVPTSRSLPEILQYFTVHGLDNEAKSPGTNEQELFLEESWTNVVDDAEKLDKKERDQQEAIWELLSTEVAYINKLQVIKKVFIACLRNLQSQGFLQELDLRSLFSNIEEIYLVNVSFWLRSLKSVVNMARHTKKLLDPFYMADGFSLFDSQFEPYVKYCMEESSCLKFLKKKQAEDEQFKLYVEWCEGRPECKRLKLSDLLVKPMQRVTKYPLLLKAILKKTVKEDKRVELGAMIETVEQFVGKVNASMKIRHEKEKLSRVAVKIEYYWPVDPVADEVEKCLMDNYCDFDLCHSMPGVYHDQHRCLLYEGALRLTEKQGRMDVYAFLFTDMLLLTKAKKMDKFKIVKVPMRIDKVKVHDLKDPGNFLVVYVNEYRTVVQAYVFQTSQDVKEKWTRMINKAKNLYQAILQSDGTKCLTADDVGFQSPATTPAGSPSLARKAGTSWNQSLGAAVPVVTVSSSRSSPTLRGHLSGSDGNLALVGLSDHSANSAIVRRASCNERKTKSKRESPRRPRTESKVTRSTSDPHNKPLRDDVTGLSRSSSVPQAPKPIPDRDLHLLTESSVDPDSPRSTTSISEVDFTVSVDVDEIHMSLSPDAETPLTSPQSDVAPSESNRTMLDNPRGTSEDLRTTAESSRTVLDDTRIRSESGRVSSDNSRAASESARSPKMTRNGSKESSEKLKLLLAQKLSNAKDHGKDDDVSPSHDAPRRDRKRHPRSSSLDRSRRPAELKSPMGSDSVVTSPSDSGSGDGRKPRLTRMASSGSRQLPDPSQITVKSSRNLPKAQSSGETNDERTSGKIQDLTSDTGLSSPAEKRSDGVTEPVEPGRSQAPPIKAPLISGIGVGRNNSNGTERKRPSQLKRSPVLYRKANKEEIMRRSMDEQLLEPRHSPPVRRAKSEADSPIEALRGKTRHSERTHSRSSDHRSRSRHSDASTNSERTLSRDSDVSTKSDRTIPRNTETSTKSDRTIPRKSEVSTNSDRTLSGNSEVSTKSERTHSRNSENLRNSEETEKSEIKTFNGTSSEDHERSRLRSKGFEDDVTSSDSKKSSHGSARESSSGTAAEQTRSGDKPRRQIKKYRTHARKHGDVDGGSKGSNHVVEPYLLESSEYV